MYPVTKNIFLLAIRFLLISTLLISGLAGCKQQKQEKTPPQPVSVKVEKVHSQYIEYYHEYPGLVTAYDQVTLVSQVTGYVTGTLAGDGQFVKKGDVVYTIDNEQFQAMHDQAQAKLEAAIAAYEKAKKDVDRYEYLKERDAIAGQTYDYALATLETAEMQVKAAEEDVVNQSAYLRYSVIRAPLTGYMGFSNVSKGTLVTAGGTVLNTVSIADPILVDIHISEKEIPEFLRNIDNQSATSLLTLKLPNGTLYPDTGVIASVGQAVDPQTGTLRARINYPNPRLLMKNGMTCTVCLKASGEEKHILIPATAMTEQMSEYFVFLLNPDSTVREQKIIPARILGNQVAVQSGLTDGDEIVTEGIQNLKNGIKVTYTKTN